MNYIENYNKMTILGFIFIPVYECKLKPIKSKTPCKSLSMNYFYIYIGDGGSSECYIRAIFTSLTLF